MQLVLQCKGAGVVVLRSWCRSAKELVLQRKGARVAMQRSLCCSANEFVMQCKGAGIAVQWSCSRAAQDCGGKELLFRCKRASVALTKQMLQCNQADVYRMLLIEQVFADCECKI